MRLVRVPSLLRLAILVCIGISARTGNAFELATEGVVGVIRTDNASPGSAQESAATLGTLRVGAELRSLTPRLAIDLDTSMTHFEYLEDGNDSETLPQISGTATWQIMPERLNWSVREEYGQVGGLNFGEIRPVDRDDVSYFTTGPTLTLPLGSRNSFEVSGTYSDVNSSGVSLDSTRYMGSAQLLRRVSDRRTVGALYSFTKIEYDGVVAFDGYDRSVAAVTFESVARRGTIVAQLGLSKVSQPGGGDDTSPLFALTITRRLGARNALAFVVSSQSSDAADAFRDGIGGSIASGGDTALPVNAEPFVVDSTSLEWNYAAVRFSAQARMLYEKERYQGSALAGRQRTGALAAGSYRWSSRSESGASIQYQSNSSVDPVFDDRSWGLSLSHSLRIASNLYGMVNYTRFDRDRNTSVFSQSENRWMLSISYLPSPFTIGRPVDTERQSLQRGMRRRAVGGDLSAPESADAP